MSTMISREERRRRIMERGSDRLALITGRIKDIPGSPPPSPSSLSNTPQHPLRTRSFPNQPSFLQNRLRHSDDSQSTLPHPLHVCSENKEDEDDCLGPSSPAIRDIHEVVSNKNNDSFDITKNNIDEPSNKNTITASVVQSDDIGEEMNIIKLEGKRSSIPQKSQIDKDKELFTSKRLTSCIIASQNTRIISTLIIAVWVLSSYFDCPLFGKNILISESSSFRTKSPLYILLITDVTIVLFWLYFDKLRGFEELEEEVDQEPLDYHENWETAVKLLERGLILYQAVCGVFTDFSVYVVVVVCGISLVL